MISISGIAGDGDVPKSDSKDGIVSVDPGVSLCSSAGVLPGTAPSGLALKFFRHGVARRLLAGR